MLAVERGTAPVAAASSGSPAGATTAACPELVPGVRGRHPVIPTLLSVTSSNPCFRIGAPPRRRIGLYEARGRTVRRRLRGHVARQWSVAWSSSRIEHLHPSGPAQRAVPAAADAVRLRRPRSADRRGTGLLPVGLPRDLQARRDAGRRCSRVRSQPRFRSSRRRSSSWWSTSARPGARHHGAANVAARRERGHRLRRGRSSDGQDERSTRRSPTTRRRRRAPAFARLASASVTTSDTA